MKHTSLFFGILSVTLGLALAVGPISAASPTAYNVGGKVYYTVKANDSTMNSGNKVCALLGKTCVGYTALNTTVCKQAHPTAKTLTSVNGSKAGFYCDGAPQKGLACQNVKNTCEICPACNVNLDCTTDLTAMNQFREAYVECGPSITAKSSSSAYGAPKMPSSVSRSARSVSSRGVARSSSKSSARSSVSSVPVGVKVCKFDQSSTKKYVVPCTTTSATNYCKTVMGTPSVTGTCSNNNTLVTCSVSCTAQGISNLTRCPFGATTPTPTGICASSSKASVATKKPAGAICQHGGDCISGWCMGVIPGQLYQCSCNTTYYSTTNCNAPTK